MGEEPELTLEEKFEHLRLAVNGLFQQVELLTCIAAAQEQLLAETYVATVPKGAITARATAMAQAMSTDHFKALRQQDTLGPELPEIQAGTYAQIARLHVAMMHKLESGELLPFASDHQLKDRMVADIRDLELRLQDAEEALKLGTTTQEKRTWWKRS